MSTRYWVTVFLKAGGSFSFICRHLEIETDETGQRIVKMEWQDAEPAPLFLHLDNIGAVIAQEID